jgi:two-component system, chemotaxis family, CheB/CheR fusion protein
VKARKAREQQLRARAARPSKKRLQSQASPQLGGVPPQGTEALKPADPIPAGARSTFPIVGIGASAGGLEALEQFLKHVPARSGMAFVIIQHLDPAHKGAMVELLQRASPIPVAQAKDRQKVQPNCVYVIPPAKDMSILHGRLYLLPPAAQHGLNLPIDFFFRSLAEDQQERSIGVILSGMGSDGTSGLRAIKEKAGAAFVQSLESAKFSAMPRSAMDTGLADVVDSAEELPARILAYHHAHAPYVSKQKQSPEDKRQSDLEKVFILLRAHTGNDFSLYKRSTIFRRIERRMSLHQIEKLASYVRYLRENPRELELLFKELLIGVTNFFRDPPAWEHLRKEALPALVRKRAQGRMLRAWVAGCSTGEEAYSLAIALRETVEDLKLASHLSIQIFATDLDREAIEKARQASYPANIAADVSPERLRRFFQQYDTGYRVRKEIREMVVFAPQNIVMDPPFTKLDILACRNLLIYLSPDLQKKLIPLFHYALNPDGVLFLGNSETVGTYSNLFSPIDAKARTYRRVEMPIEAPMVEFPPAFARPSASVTGTLQAARVDLAKAPPANLPQLADRVIIQRFAPAAILTNEKGDILYFSGRTGKYLEPAAGKANLNVFAMAREGLRYALSSALSTAIRTKKSASVKGIKLASDGAPQFVDLTVQRLDEPAELRGMVMIIIADVPAASEEPKGRRKSSVAAEATLKERERELQHAREEIRTTREEMQTSQEELKSTNEELQSTNEELQSTNEELTTSKEEMQSMNEELQTVNHELQSKVDELSRANNDMTNLLNSTDIATLFLDGALNVRRFTTPTAQLFKLIGTDAGRPITDIATSLDYPDLVEDAQDVLRTLIFKEKQIPSRNGRWFTVRILPYRTLENVIDGVVLTFSDSTAANLLKVTLRAQAIEAMQMAESLPDLVWGFRTDGTCDYVSKQWVEFTGVPAVEQLGNGWLEQLHPEDRERIRTGWRAAVESSAEFNTLFRIRDRTVGKDSFRWFKARVVPIRDEQEKTLKWYALAIDVNDLKSAADEQRAATQQAICVLDGIDSAVITLNGAQSISYMNAAAERLLARTRDQVLGKSFSEVFPQTPGTDFNARLADAVRQHRALSFRARLGDTHRQESYDVRILPASASVSVCLQSAGELPQEPSPRSTIEKSAK